jgi:hypothetical protein
MPHGYRHANLTEMPLTSAIDLVRACLDEFDEHLKGFDRSKAVFNFPYNASNKLIEEFVGTQVRALRTGYSAFNPLPHKGLKRLTCSSFGPENAERFLDSEIDKLLKQPSGWMIFNAHGLDDEGWGPISSDYLKKLLDRLTRIETVELLPAGMALARADSVIY